MYGQKSRVDSHTREKKLLPLAWCNTPAKCLDLRNAHIPMLYEKKTVLCLTHKPYPYAFVRVKKVCAGHEVTLQRTRMLALERKGPGLRFVRALFRYPLPVWKRDILFFHILSINLYDEG